MGKRLAKSIVLSTVDGAIVGVFAGEIVRLDNTANPDPIATLQCQSFCLF